MYRLRVDLVEIFALITYLCTGPERVGMRICRVRAAHQRYAARSSQPLSFGQEMGTHQEEHPNLSCQNVSPRTRMHT